MRARTLVTTGLLAGVLGGMLAGCSEDPSDGSDRPTSSATPSTPSESTTAASGEPTPPPLPDAATRGGRKGAEAFLRHYWELVNYAQETGDTAPLRAVQADGCDGCNGGNDWIEKVYAEGGRIEGGHYTVRAADAHKTPSRTGWLAGATVHMTRETVSGAGDLDATYPSGRSSWIFTLQFADDSWRVTSLEHE